MGRGRAAGDAVKTLVTAAVLATSVLFAKAAKLETLHEGRRTHVYDDFDGSPLDHGIRRRDGKPCRKHPTVGIGCNLDRGGARSSLAAVGADYDAVRSGTADLTAEQIDLLFEFDLHNAMAEVHRIVPDLYELPEAVQLVLVDMTFNMGSVRGFPRMLAAIRERNWREMIIEMVDSDWWRGPTRVRAEHDIEIIRQLLVPDDEDLAGGPEFTAEDRERVLAMIAIVTNRTIAEELVVHAEKVDVPLGQG